MASPDNLKLRLNAIDWSSFQTAYGAATNVPQQIERMNSPDEKVALSGIRELWAGLCHQEVQIASAALPALPFIMERLPAPSDKVTAEVLDILAGFAVTTDPLRAEQYQQALGRKSLPQPSWIVDVRSRLRAELDRIAAFTTHQNAEVAECAKRIIEELS
jgi:hypothetical protein